VGGAFPNDDPTTIAGTDITLALGAQNGSQNGLYNLATITIPDPNQVCSGSEAGRDGGGNPTCTFPAVALVAGSQGRFAIFAIAENIVSDIPMTIYLLQQ
jgi:hypothetical protein